MQAFYGLVFFECERSKTMKSHFIIVLSPSTANLCQIITTLNTHFLEFWLRSKSYYCSLFIFVLRESRIFSLKYFKKKNQNKPVFSTIIVVLCFAHLVYYYNFVGSFLLANLHALFKSLTSRNTFSGGLTIFNDACWYCNSGVCEIPIAFAAVVTVCCCY